MQEQTTNFKDGNTMESDPLQDLDSEETILDENNANSEANGATLQTLKPPIQLTNSKDQNNEIGRLIEFNRELTTRHANLQAQFAELMKEYNKLQYKYNMLELTTMQNSQGDGPNSGGFYCDSDTILAAQYRADLRKVSTEKAAICQQATKMREDLRQATTRLSFLQSYVGQLQHRVVQRDRIIQKLMQERALNVVRDVHARMLHNELIEMRGGIRVIVR